MADLVWQWMIPPVSGVCAQCREPLLKYRDGLVRFLHESYHLHCLLDRLTSEVPNGSMEHHWNGL
jgi:hypothetical protein